MSSFAKIGLGLMGVAFCALIFWFAKPTGRSALQTPATEAPDATVQTGTATQKKKPNSKLDQEMALLEAQRSKLNDQKGREAYAITNQIRAKQTLKNIELLGQLQAERAKQNR